MTVVGKQSREFADEGGGASAERDTNETEAVKRTRCVSGEKEKENS